MPSPNYTELVLASTEVFNLSRAGILLDYPAVLSSCQILVRNHHDSWALGSHPSHHFEESEESCEEPKIGAKNVNKGSWYEVHDT